MLGKFSRREFAKRAAFFRGWNGDGACEIGEGEARPGQDTPAAASFKTTVFAGLSHRFPWHLKELG
jgi:hypothetical protein